MENLSATTDTAEETQTGLPPEMPSSRHPKRTRLFQMLACLYILMGISYLTWRWYASLNPDIPVISAILAGAESLLFAGSVLRIANYWSYKDPVPQKPVHRLYEITNYGNDDASLRSSRMRPVTIDVFIATYNEEASLVRNTIRKAQAMEYPWPDVPIRIYILDDGERDGRDPDKEDFRSLAREEGGHYLCRYEHQGYKAGNLNHGFWQTDGDLILILDADTEVFPDLLKNTTGYFRNPKLAWVQTPQWYHDIIQGSSLTEGLSNHFGVPGKKLAGLLERFFGRMPIGKDIFCSNPKMFYDGVLRNRNFCNAAFSCGAGAVYRRESLEHYAEYTSAWYPGTNELPFRHHISEDLYNSMLMHAEKGQERESLYHPYPESTMTSPRDLDSWVQQQMRYASGSIAIGMSKNNPLRLKGLSFWQKVQYFSTFYSFFTPLLSFIFFMIPVYYFFTFNTPILYLGSTFLYYFIPFQVLNLSVFLLGNWGISTKRPDQKYWASFWYVTRSWLRVLLPGKLRFNVTPKNATGNKALKHVLPHLIVTGLTAAGLSYNLVLFIQGVHPSPAALAVFGGWGIYNIYQLNAYMRAGLYGGGSEE